MFFGIILVAAALIACAYARDRKRKHRCSAVLAQVSACRGILAEAESQLPLLRDLLRELGGLDAGRSWANSSAIVDLMPLRISEIKISLSLIEQNPELDQEGHERQLGRLEDFQKQVRRYLGMRGKLEGEIRRAKKNS